MHIPVCYCPPECFRGDKIVLPNDEARHINRVLRLEEGERLITVDGQGHAYEGVLISDERWGGSSMRIEKKIDSWGEPKVELTLAFGISVGTKADEIVEKGTELGVSYFVPIISTKGKVKYESSDKNSNRQLRLERVAVAAMKQCRRSRLPEISVPRSLAELLEDSKIHTSGPRLLFHPEGESLASIMAPLKESRSFTVITGAESGFSEEEIDLAKSSGCAIVSLGTRILRAENAAPIVCALVMQLVGELG